MCPRFPTRGPRGPEAVGPERQAPNASFGGAERRRRAGDQGPPAKHALRLFAKRAVLVKAHAPVLVQVHVPEAHAHELERVRLARVARAHQHARELLRCEQPVAVDVPFVEILGARARKRRVQCLRLWRRGGEAPRGREGLARGHDRFRIMGFVREVRRPERPVVERGADAVPLKRLAA